MKIVEKCSIMGYWMSAALSDPNVCPEMKRDIIIYLSGIEELKTDVKEMCEVLTNVLEVDNGGQVDYQSVCYILNKFDRDL